MVAVFQPWKVGPLGVLFLLSVCSAQAESRYIRQAAGSRRVMVFVHGVMGDSTGTWTNDAAKTYWPKLISEDKDFDGVDLFVVSYPTPGSGPSLTIDELAENLRLTLDQNAVTNYQELIFVCHSMGGLVARAYLVKYRESAKKVKMIYFFATPTTGAGVASLARLFSRNPQFGKMASMTSESYLADLQRAWQASPELRAIPSFCAYEIRPTFGVKIVEQQSATNLCNQRLDPIDSNHIDIVKPAFRTDPMYAALQTAYRSAMPVPPKPINVTPTKTVRPLRLEAQDLKQYRALMGAQPKLNGKPVYCDSLDFTLLLAHTKSVNTPILVNSISVHSEPLSGAGSLPPEACAVDRLSSHPYGRRNIETYSVTAEDARIRVGYQQTATSAFEVSPDNILDLPSSAGAVTLDPGETYSLRIKLDDISSAPLRIWFSAQYDANGPQTLTSEPILIWR